LFVLPLLNRFLLSTYFRTRHVFFEDPPSPPSPLSSSEGGTTDEAFGALWAAMYQPVFFEDPPSPPSPLSSSEGGTTDEAFAALWAAMYQPVFFEDPPSVDDKKG
jgi:hypothetical protein